MADDTKFGRVTLASFGPIESAHVLTTEPAALRPLFSRIRQHTVEVMVAGRRRR